MISKKRCFLYVKNANLAKKLLEIIGFLPIFQSGKVELVIVSQVETTPITSFRAVVACKMIVQVKIATATMSPEIFLASGEYRAF
jgi:hypothetical protein